MSEKREPSKRSVYNITGVAGEYFVAAELSRRGWIATMTIKNSPNIDVIATLPDGSRTINVQVKTRSIGNRQGWILNKNIDNLVTGQNFYIAFVDLVGHDEKPDYFIIPKNVFAKWSAKRHKGWLAGAGRDGHIRVDNSIRTFDRPTFHMFEKYHNNWNI